MIGDSGEYKNKRRYHSYKRRCRNNAKKLKNRKSPGQDKIPNELLKCGGESLMREIVKLINKILTQHKIPDSWRTSTMIFMFKKGDKKDPSNFRGINLLSSTLKLVTNIITTKIDSLITLAEEQ